MKASRFNYVKVKWLHPFDTEPRWIYSELDAERWEVRKVEVFPDGSYGYAFDDVEHGGTRLGTEPLPSLGYITAQEEFMAFGIGREEFEVVWLKALVKC